jgi:hypothetical protein
MNEVDQARTQLRRVVETLQAIRSQLVGLQASIPPTGQETSREDLEGEPDAPTAIRAALANALRDRLDPLIEDLREVAGLP